MGGVLIFLWALVSLIFIIPPLQLYIATKKKEAEGQDEERARLVYELLRSSNGWVYDSYHMWHPGVDIAIWIANGENHICFGSTRAEATQNDHLKPSKKWRKRICKEIELIKNVRKDEESIKRATDLAHSIIEFYETQDENTPSGGINHPVPKSARRD